MTIKGPDISSFQAGLNVRALTDPFVLMKCTEGTGYADAYYAGWLAQAKASGKIVIPYHFVTDADPAAQAAWLAAHIGDVTLPVMLDWEPEGAYKPPLAQLYAVADAMVARKLRPKLAYAPRWHWANIGSPPLSGLTSRGIGLISSAYPGGSGYPGDNAAGWQSYGGVTPWLYQYTDVAYEGGQKVGDMNACRLTMQQLAAFLGTASPSSPPTSHGSDVNLTDVLGPVSSGMAAIAPDAGSEQMGAGATYTVGAALLGTAERSAETLILVKRLVAGNNPAGLASAVVAAIVPHLPTSLDQGAFTDAVVAAVESHAPGTVDLDALAGLVVSHLAAALNKA